MTGLVDSPGDQEIFSWWGGAENIFLKIDFQWEIRIVSCWIPPPYQEKISLSPGPLMFYFVFNVVTVLIENLWKVNLKYFWWFDWKSMKPFSKNLLTLLNGLELSPGDQEIFSWWGGAGNIYFMFYAVDDLIGNLWKIYLKYFNFIERFRGFTRRPRDFLLVGWGWEYLFFNWFSIGDKKSFLMLWLEIYENKN